MVRKLSNALAKLNDTAAISTYCVLRLGGICGVSLWGSTAWWVISGSGTLYATISRQTQRLRIERRIR